MNPESVRSTCIQSRLRIQSTQSKFKVIEFTNSKKTQERKPVGDKEFMAYLGDIPIVLNDNGLLFKNNFKYIWPKFM